MFFRYFSRRGFVFKSIFADALLRTPLRLWCKIQLGKGLQSKGTDALLRDWLGRGRLRRLCVQNTTDNWLSMKCAIRDFSVEEEAVGELT